jgi:hypothetical protein
VPFTHLQEPCIAIGGRCLTVREYNSVQSSLPGNRPLWIRAYKRLPAVHELTIGSGDSEIRLVHARAYREQMWMLLGLVDEEPAR